MTIQHLAGFSKAHGQFHTYKPCPPTVIEKYQPLLPEILTDTWREAGFQVFSGGFLWTVNPDEFRDIIADFLHDYQIKDVHVMFRTALGDMILSYKEKFYHFSVVTMRHSELPGALNAILEIDLGQKQSLKDVFFFHLFRKALKKLGEITEDEMYAFFPALSLGGDLAVENIRRVNMRAHLHFLSQV